MEQSNAVLTRAAELVKAGNKREAASLLRQLLQAEPGNVRAWGILSMAVDDVEERRESLQAVARFGDERMSAWARQQLAAMLPPPQLDFDLPSEPLSSRMEPEPSNSLADFAIPDAPLVPGATSSSETSPAGGTSPFLIIGAVIVALACLLLAVALLLPSIQNRLAPRPTPSPLPPTAVPTATIAVTRKPRPTPTITNTPPPTKTHVPRPTPTPTETEGPSPTPGNIPTSTSSVIPTQTNQLTVPEYGAALAQPMKDMGTALNDVADLVNEMIDKRDLLFDKDWQAKVNADVVTVQANHKKIAVLNPPPELADMHSTLIDGTQDCSDSMDHLTSAIHLNNPSELELSITLINSCIDKVDAADKKLEDYLKSH